MNFILTDIKNVVLIEPEIFGDQRGFFIETWESRKFAEAGINATFVQDNHSRSARNVLRGFHYQIRQPQGKLVRAVLGTVFDVAVDLRKSSPSFGKWVGEILSDENKRMLWVPPGFGHGFYVISEYAEVVYKCTDFYAPLHERSILWDDADLAVTWPVPEGQVPILSAKDKAGELFRDAECFP